ncbi:MAG: thioredoxin family protein [Anaerolineales bacterium]|jgi:disulfide oxidoreductase YuzD
MNIEVKILGTKTPQRYAVRRAVVAAQAGLGIEYPDLQLEISEVRDLAEIEKITPVFIYPSLVVNDKLVCVGRFPQKGEVLIWLQQALSGCA